MTAYASDRDILITALEWLRQGHHPALVTVARTWGSSPRPVGSLMLMREDGQHVGSVSGGCVEADLLSRYRNRELASPLATLIDYGINREDATRFGLPCGGRLELLVEKLANAAQLETLLARITHHELLARRVCLNTGEVSLHPASATDEFEYQDGFVKKIFGPRWQMLLIGAGHLSHYVAQMALLLDYRVIICDPREEYQHTWLTSEIGKATEFIADMPDEAIARLAGHPRCIIITLTHDPKLDDLALIEALASPAFYVGAIGSRRNNQLRRERLSTLGVTPAQLQRLHAPVGLAIGSHTPPEIAVAILAEITALRNQAQSAQSASRHTNDTQTV